MRVINGEAAHAIALKQESSWYIPEITSSSASTSSVFRKSESWGQKRQSTGQLFPSGWSCSVASWSATDGLMWLDYSLRKIIWLSAEGVWNKMILDT